MVDHNAGTGTANSFTQNFSLIYTAEIDCGNQAVIKALRSLILILPVHSQKRGKLFLPFVDEDPKTAEITFKIVLLAEDSKIRDPFILEQIRG